MTDHASPYVLEDLTHECAHIPCPFTDMETKTCDEGGQEAQETPPVDLEAEARRMFEEAYAEGEKAGIEMGMQKLQPVAERLGAALQECADFRGRLKERSERLATELALLFAEAIVRKECDGCRDVIMRMAKRALELIDEKSGIVVRMRPEDIPFVSASDASAVTILPDDGLKEPGFVIETPIGDIDGRLSTQLTELTRRVLSGEDDDTP